MPKRNEKKKSEGKGRRGKRKVNEVTFHSLRHNFTTMLKAAGGSNSMAQSIVGHKSSAVAENLKDGIAVASMDKLNEWEGGAQ